MLTCFPTAEVVSGPAVQQLPDVAASCCYINVGSLVMTLAVTLEEAGRFAK